jgi:hypothetical protein
MEKSGEISENSGEVRREIWRYLENMTEGEIWRNLEKSGEIR